MKIFSAAQIREIDAYTIEHEPIPSIELMERASLAFVHWFVKRFSDKNPIQTFCGLGNNGGDGLAITRLLLERGFQVEVFICRFSKNSSPDFQLNEQRLKKLTKVYEITDEASIPKITEGLVIDALFGSGLSRPISGFTAKLVEKINQGNCTTISVDIASGLYCDSYNADPNIIKPDHTVSFQFPKLAFLLPKNHKYCGEFHLVNIGLSPKKIADYETPFFYLKKETVQHLYKKRGKYSHKGTYGHLQIIAGSYGKIGAAVLALRAGLKTGVGLLTAFVPKCGYAIVQSCVPEAMCLTDTQDEHLSTIETAPTASYFALGPGIGKHPDTLVALRNFLEKAEKPLVIDADAINLISENPDLLNSIPQNSIFTPHPKEFERLVGKWENEFERLEKLRQFCQQHQFVCIIKGAHTAIGLPNGKIYFNSTGNPGMATGGSGDVLTGMIGSLLAQGYPPKEATLLGVYLHGLAGDIAARKLGMEAVSATDIINNIGNAFQVVAQ
ncbi:NAD(P)H-hydrate dehydratase [Flammeovirgaceae bacterium SG7u.111]|nr:NAD(P)H-hydrate dehydratase [Flammeovirgaceae bacterium SG7u.132]WPO35297.1 NAD(P)H-hydrate dehydratase [Flammeovirgaceae bacterium SG7u.111]